MLYTFVPGGKTTTVTKAHREKFTRQLSLKTRQDGIYRDFVVV
jgi:hypothetical protein